MPAKRKDLGPEHFADAMESLRHANQVAPIWSRLERIEGQLEAALASGGAAAAEIRALVQELTSSRWAIVPVTPLLLGDRILRGALAAGERVLAAVRQPLELWRARYGRDGDHHRAVRYGVLERRGAGDRPEDHEGGNPAWSVAERGRLYWNQAEISADDATAGARRDERKHWTRDAQRYADRAKPRKRRT